MEEQLVKLLPATTEMDNCGQPLLVLQRFQFILNNADWKLLLKLGNERGDPFAAMFQAIYYAVTCDEHGTETEWPSPETVEESPFFLVQIQCEDFRATGIRPGDFNDYLGETRLIPIVYEMVHFPLET